MIFVVIRLRTGSLDSDSTKMNGIDSLDIERFKNDIMIEIRKEFNKMKTEIIDGLSLCFSFAFIKFMSLLQP